MHIFRHAVRSGRRRAVPAIVLTTIVVVAFVALGSTSAFADEPEVPGVPTGVAVSTCGDGTCSLTWSAPADDGGSAVTSYEVRYSDDYDASWTVASNSSPRVAQTVRGLTNGRVYDFQVAAVNGAGAGEFSYSSDSGYPHAPPPPLHNTRTTFASSAQFVRYHHRVTVSGTVRDTVTGAPLANVGVFLARSSIGGFSYSSTSRRTNSAGKVSMSFAPSHSGHYKWVFPGDSLHKRSVSGQHTIMVAATVTARLGHTHVRHGHNVVITGSVAPNQGSRTVHLLQRIRGKWYLEPPKATLDWRSRYRMAFTYKKKAKLTLAVWFPGDSSNARWSSHPFTLHST